MTTCENKINIIPLRNVINKKRVLIVDDEPYNILGMEIKLSRLGIKGLQKFVDRAYNG